jgi:hypothetical protein
MPAPIIPCPTCERKLRLPDGICGRSVKCPNCGEGFVIERNAKADGEGWYY